MAKGADVPAASEYQYGTVPAAHTADNVTLPVPQIVGVFEVADVGAAGNRFTVTVTVDAVLSQPSVVFLQVT